MAQTVLEVRGMTCGHCVNAVSHALQGVPGVEHVQVDLATGRAHVVGAATALSLVAAVNDEGYEARIACA